MPDKVSLTNEELQAAVTAGLFHDPSVLDKLDTDSRQRYVQLAPTEGPRMSAPSADTPVTLGDLQDNPREAMKRIGQIVKRDVSDPKLWLGLAASYFGPKMLNVAIPIVAKAAAGAKTGFAAIPPGEVVGMISPRLGHAVRVGQALRGAMPAEPVAPPATSAIPSAVDVSPLELTRQLKAANQAAATSPAESVAGGTPPPVDPPVVARPAESPAAPRPSATPGHPTRSVGQMSPQAIQNDLGVAARRLKVSLPPGSPQAAQAEALVRQGTSVEDAVQASALPAKVKLSAAESTVYDALRKSGLSDEQAAKLLTATRTLNANLPTDAEVQAAVRKRNETGRWE
jgi:hypothetical protein